MESSYVKPDPDSKEAIALEEDTYEDTGDGELQIPNPVPEAWLARIPAFVHEQWAKIGDDEEIVLGYLDHYTKSNKYEMVLDAGKTANKGLPKIYKIHVGGSDTANTFIFSEQDLPEFKKKAKKEEQAAAAGGANGNGVSKFTRFRKTVPKQTKLQAVIKKEITADASSTAEFMKFLQDRHSQDDPSRYATAFLEGDPTKHWNALNIEKTKGAAALAPTTIRDHRKAIDQRAARIPEDQLKDAIFHQFQRYKYWSMENMLRQINQPKEYVRDILNVVADFVKGGPFHNNYMLKPEYSDQAGVDATDGLAPEVKDDDSLADENMKDEGGDTDLSMTEAP